MFISGYVWYLLNVKMKCCLLNGWCWMLNGLKCCQLNGWYLWR